MAEKVVVSISRFIKNSKENKYQAPNGKSYPGEASTDAPIKYLLDEHPDISEIICIVTKESEGDAFDWFNETVHDLKADIIIGKPILYDEIEAHTFDAMLGQLFERVHPKDKVYFDTTGGFRPTQTFLFLAIYALQYQQVEFGQAVYGQLPPKDSDETGYIFDVTEQYRTVDLISGLNEFTSFGSVKTLKRYFKSKENHTGLQVEEDVEENKRIEKLLTAMEKLTDDISLCRTNLKSLDNFNDQMKSSDSIKNPIIQTFVTLFRDKYGKNMDALDIIRWCIDNNMLQQALMIYVEKVPESFFGPKGFIELANGCKIEDIITDKNGFTVNSASLLSDYIFSKRENSEFLKCKGKKYNEHKTDMKDEFKSIPQLVEEVGYYPNHPERLYQVKMNELWSANKVTAVLLDYFYFKQLRNMIAHADEKLTQRPGLHNELDYKKNWPAYFIKQKRNLKIETLSVEKVKAEVQESIKRLKG